LSVIFCGAWSIVGCKKTTNLDVDPAFASTLGKTFKTKRDLLVVDFKGSKKSLAVDIPGTSGVPELKDIPTKLPGEYYGAIIYGVIPAGTTLQLVHIEKVETFESSFTDFYAAIIDGNFKGRRVDISSLTNQNGRVPELNREFIE
jgi:hypothetical protein